MVANSQYGHGLVSNVEDNAMGHSLADSKPKLADVLGREVRFRDKRTPIRHVSQRRNCLERFFVPDFGFVRASVCRPPVKCVLNIRLGWFGNLDLNTIAATSPVRFLAETAGRIQRSPQCDLEGGRRKGAKGRAQKGAERGRSSFLGWFPSARLRRCRVALVFVPPESAFTY